MGWCQRTAAHQHEFAFAADYLICPRCRLGSVEQPSTAPRYQRCGLGIASLATLRAKHPGLAWQTCYRKAAHECSAPMGHRPSSKRWEKFGR